MSLIKCCECGTNVSEYAEKCPSCGCPISVIKKQCSVKQYKINFNNGKEIDLTGFEEKISEQDLQNRSFVVRTLIDDFGVSGPLAYNIGKMLEFNNYKFPDDYQALYDAMCEYNQRSVEAATANKPKCPTCGSTNVKKISATSKAVSVGLFGLFSQKVKHQMKCNKCGYEW